MPKVEKPAEGALAANVAAAFEGFTEAPDGGFVGPDPDDGTGAPAPEAAPKPTPTSASAEAPPVVEPKAAEAAPTETPAGAPATGTVDAPERYFEVDLSGLPAEERVKVVDALKERDDEIGKLLRGKAKDEPAAPAAPAAPAEEVQPPAQVSDEDIVKHLGLDPENPFDETAAKVGVPLVRELLSLRGVVEQLAEDRQADQHLQTWHNTLDTLEKLHGELPLDRTAFIEFAAENNLQDPESAFWRVMGPARRQVEEAVKAAEERIRAAGGPAAAAPSAAAVSSTRPRTTGATEEAPVEGQNIRDAVKDAGLKVLRDLGIGD